MEPEPVRPPIDILGVAVNFDEQHLILRVHAKDASEGSPRVSHE